VELKEFGWSLVFRDGGGRGGLHNERGDAEEREWRAGGGGVYMNEKRC
jgi:hypothetical protein